MDGDEEVGTTATGAAGAFGQRDVGIVAAGKKGAEAFFAVDVFFQAVCDLQDDIFFAQAAAGVNRAGVFAAVARVNGDDNGFLRDGSGCNDVALFFDFPGRRDFALNSNGGGAAF